jgi:hypothetical protein
MIPSNLVSKIISSVAVGMLFMNILFSGYIVSLLDNKISEKEFTISQSLAFGNKISLVVLFVVSLLLTGYLVFYRKQTKLYTIINIILLIIIGAFLITIVWITAHKNAHQHYAFASIIFICLVVFITLNSVSLWNGLPDKKLYQKILIILLPTVLYLSLIGLGTGFILHVTDKNNHVFPSFENIILVLTGLSILELGFI